MEVEDDLIMNKTVAGAKPFIVVGIPAFNEEMTIARVVLEAQKYADRVVVCDDGSTDLTADIAERLGAEVIRHKENLGYGVAVQSLFKYARESGADVLVTLDADGQHFPKEIPNVVQPIFDDVADMVIGSRFVDGKLARTMPWYRRIGIDLISRLVNNGTKYNVKDSQSGFRAYNRKCLKGLTLLEDGMGISAEILISAGKQDFRISEVPSSCSYEEELETSTHNPVKHLVDVVTSIIKSVVENRPLTLLGIPGILCLITGVFFGVWMLQIYAMEHRIVTNIALASIAFILIGFFSLSTAITLYAITRLNKRMTSG